MHFSCICREENGEEDGTRRGQNSMDMRRGGGGRRSVEWTRDTSRLKIVGDASETAIFRFCNQIKPIELYQAESPKIFEIPFNSTNKYQLSIHKVEVRIGDRMKERRLLVMKGAPEIILAKCSHVLMKGERKPIDDVFKEEFDSAYKRFGSYGERAWEQNFERRVFFFFLLIGFFEIRCSCVC